MTIHPRTRNTLALAVLATIAGTIGAADPDSRLAEKPPYQRLLQDNDAKQAADLEKQISERLQASQWAEAVMAAQEVLALRQRLQGAEHWQTISARWYAVTLQKLAAGSADDRAAWASAGRLTREGHALFQKRRPAEAESLLQQALELYRQLHGEEHPYLAILCHDLALNHSLQGQRAKAEPLLRKAVDIRRRVLGEEHPDTATSSYTLANNLNAQLRYADAEALYRRALATRQKVLGPEHAETLRSGNALAQNLDKQGKYKEAESLYRQVLAVRQKESQESSDVALSLNNLASNLDNQGRHSEAEPLLREALALSRRVRGEEHRETATCCNNLGYNLNAQGRYAEAEPFYQQGLALRRKVLGEKHPHTIQSYSNVAYNLQVQGKYAEAEPLHRRALALRRNVLGDEHPDTTQSLNNLAGTLHALTRYAEAEPLFRQALAARRKLLGEDHPDVATCYENVAMNLQVQGKAASALAFEQKALAIRRRELGEEHPDTAASYHNLGGCLFDHADFEAAESLFRRALALRQKALGMEHPLTVADAGNVAHALYAQGKYADAEGQWRAAWGSFEAARLRISTIGLDRATFTAGNSPLPGLTVCLARAGQAADAWKYCEANLARGLLDEVSARLARSLSDEERRRERELLGRLEQLDGQILALLRKPRETNASQPAFASLIEQRQALLSELARWAASLTAREVSDQQHIQARLPIGAALLTWVDFPGLPGSADPGGEHWACLLRSSGAPLWVKLPGNGPNGAWRRDDDALPDQLRKALVEKSNAAEPARQLARQRLAPLEPHLKDVRHLIVLPSLYLDGIPLEVLTERFTISYAPSGTLLARLREKPHPANPPRRLLALGDPVFRAAGSVAALPGTRREVESIGALFPYADKLLGADASKAKLATLELQGYDALHVATHCVVNPHVAFDSALMLSQTPDDDGRLTALQLKQRWPLRAELVVLSACATGLGRYAGGEGYVGFSQALFLAGARSLVVSLWPVDDTATALLMTRFYENLLGKRTGLDRPLSKAAALREAKAWLSGLSAGQIDQEVARLPKVDRGEVRTRSKAAAEVHPYAHPHYWSAFILIGDPD
jgi:CHAT domain-containing protein